MSFEKYSLVDSEGRRVWWKRFVHESGLPSEWVFTGHKEPSTKLYQYHDTVLKKTQGSRQVLKLENLIARDAPDAHALAAGPMYIEDASSSNAVASTSSSSCSSTGAVPQAVPGPQGDAAEFEKSCLVRDAKSKVQARGRKMRGSGNVQSEAEDPHGMYYPLFEPGNSHVALSTAAPEESLPCGWRADPADVPSPR